MGAGQSKSSTDPSTGSGEPPKPNSSSLAVPDDTDYYTLLDVDKNVTSDDLKRAYKKLALKLHPDRNFEQVEEATALFAKVQAAYDVLSDPQERSWYDSHGLKGSNAENDGDQEHESPENVTDVEDLKKWFDPMLYRDWTEGPDGIYRTIENLFRTLAEEEEEATIEQGIREEFTPFPLFGNSNCQWTTSTKLFYDAWLSFSTKKDFDWYDVYSIQDAPDRRTRRAMENANQKARDSARKDFNETVRALVAFIRKRDPRYKTHSKLSGGTKRRNEKASTTAAQVQAKRDRKANLEKKQVYEEQAWEKGVTENFDEFLSEDEKERQNKKKEREWKQRRDERKDISGNDESDETSDEEHVEIFECSVCRKSFKTVKQAAEHVKSKKHIKALQKLEWQLRKEGFEAGFETTDDSLQKSEEEIDNSGSENSQSIRSQDKNESESERRNETENESESEIEAIIEDISATNIKKDISIDDELDNLTTVSDSDSDQWSNHSKKKERKHTDNTSNEPPKIGKAKQKRLNRAQQAKAKAVIRCVVCEETFMSKTKLFDHLKAAGHAAPVFKKK